MYNIKAESVSDALVQGIRHLVHRGRKTESRNGDVLVSKTPVTTVYAKPLNRVLFSPTRDANPFFHLMESLWMLAGRNDLKFPKYFNKRFGEYSDDGKTVHGAYGHRWRAHFGYDQLEVIATELRTNPASRRCVLAMWDATPHVIRDMDALGANDLNLAMSGGKDVPCNTHIYFLVNEGKLDMTVCCRSNDIIWGAYGANAVHMSVLMEYMAFFIGVEVGTYYQVSNNYHAYTDVYNVEKLNAISKEAEVMDFYYTPHAALQGIPAVQAFPLINTSIATWNNDLADFLDEPLRGPAYKDDFFNKIATPMYFAWNARKNQFNDGVDYLEYMADSDWKLACTQWLARREAA